MTKKHRHNTAATNTMPSQQAHRGRLPYAITVNLATLIAHREVLVHVGLHTEVQKSQRRNRAREHNPLAEARKPVTVDEDRRQHHLFQDGEQTSGQNGAEVLEDARKGAHRGRRSPNGRSGPK
jgi:hypothetical protein